MMTKSERHARARVIELLGAKGVTQENKAALIGQDREEQIARHQEAKLACTAAARRKRLTCEAVLRASPEYQAAKKAADDAERAMRKAAPGPRRLRVGRHDGFCFFIDAEGDTWEQVLEQLERVRDGR